MPGHRNLLLISYYFPPLGMGGVGRPLGLAKYLSKFGYDATILTTKEIAYPHYDYSLLEHFDHSKIVRTGSLDPSRLFRLLGIKKHGISVDSSGGIVRYLCFPDLKRGWNHFALGKASGLIRSKKFDAIITLSPPPSAHLIGLRLHQKFSLPWVADFGDVWFSRPIEEVYPTPLQRNYARRLKDTIISSANQIVSVNSAIRDQIGKGEVVANGSEIESASDWISSPAIREDKFVIGLLGTINKLSPIEPLFRAIYRLINEKPQLEDNVIVRQIGYLDEAYLNSILARYPFGKLLDRQGYHKRAEAFSLLSDCSLLYLGVFSSRLFDCLMSGKPVLAVKPKHSLSDALYSPDMIELVRNYKNGKVFDDTDEDAIYSYLADLCRKSLSGEIKSSFDPIEAEKYSTRRMAREYASLLDRLLK